MNNWILLIIFVMWGGILFYMNRMNLQLNKIEKELNSYKEIKDEKDRT